MLFLLMFLTLLLRGIFYIFLYIFFLCCRLMRNLLRWIINKKKKKTSAVQQFEFLVFLFFQKFSLGVFGLLNVTLSNFLWCELQCS